MEVKRERPCQRRYHRVTAPLKITTATGATSEAADWSLGGIRIVAWNDAVPVVGEALALVLHLPFQGFDIAFDVETEVVRKIDEHSFAVAFTKLPERAGELMTHFIDDLIRGKMASVEDTICRIDVPVTPISTKPDPNPNDDVAVRRWPIETIMMSVGYLVLGVVVFGYAAVLLYSTTMKLEVKTAVISAPLNTIRMPVQGRLLPVRYEVGQHLKKGDLIARISNPALDAKIEDTKLKVIRTREELLIVEQKARIEKERMNLYQLVSENDEEIAFARVEAQRETLKAADAHLIRMKELARDGFVTKSNLEEATLRKTTALAGLKRLELEHQQAIAMRSISKRRHYNHKVFVADLDLTEINVSAARMKLEMVLSELANLQRRKAQHVITAPNDGHLVAVFQAPDTIIDRNAPLLTLEESNALSVTAFLDQNEILEVGLSDKVSIYLPALDQFIDGTVNAIDRNASFLQPDATHYQWQSTDKRSAAVSLTIQRTHENRENLRAGLPAVVVFNRRITKDLHARIASFISSTGKVSDGLGI